MTVAGCLIRARQLLAGGWTRGSWARLCEDVAGHACEPTAEMVRLFTVEGALKVSGTEAEVLLAWDVLSEVHAPLLYSADQLLGMLPISVEASKNQVRNWLQLIAASRAANEIELDPWLERPQRQLAEVLKLFDLAISRATAREAA